MSITVVLADNNTITRQGLRSLMEQKEGFEVVGEAANGHEALILVRDKQPDIVVMDVTMPELSGMEVMRRIFEAYPSCKVVVLSMHTSTRVVSDMLRAGASGFVFKECAFEELDNAIQVVVKGEKYLSSRVAGTVIEDYVENRNGHESGRFLLRTLTSQEREVLRLVAEGKSTKDMAQTMCRSNKAIEATRGRVMEKLNAHSIAELVRASIASGLTPLDFIPPDSII